MGFRFSLLADTQDKTTFLHLVFYDGYVGQLFGFGISCTSLKKETLHSETSLNKTFWYILRPTQQLSDYLFINNIPVTLIPHSLILACKRLIISRNIFLMWETTSENIRYSRTDYAQNRTLMNPFRS